MKKLTHIAFSLIIVPFFWGYSSAQQILNGDFESWDTTYVDDPIEWLTNSFYFSLPCYPPHITATRTDDNNSGNWAVKLEAKSCIDDLGRTRLSLGFLANGNTSHPKISYGLPYTAKPKQLNFYYKFYSVGNDTGFASIVLRLFNVDGSAGQIIGEGKVSIIANKNAYTPMEIPINYYSTVQPELLQILFTTSKTLSDRKYPLLGGDPGDGAHEGTTLWIDDVTVSGGDVGIKKNEPQITWNIFPNPLGERATLRFVSSETEKITITLYGIEGKELMQLYNEVALRNRTYSTEIDGSKLHSGVYMVKFQSHETISKKIIVLK